MLNVKSRLPVQATALYSGGQRGGWSGWRQAHERPSEPRLPRLQPAFWKQSDFKRLREKHANDYLTLFAAC